MDSWLNRPIHFNCRLVDFSLVAGVFNEAADRLAKMDSSREENVERLEDFLGWMKGMFNPLYLHFYLIFMFIRMPLQIFLITNVL